MPTLNVRGRGGLHRNGCMSDCLNAFCELFSINSPLEHGHALHCGMNARQICVPIQHKTKGKSDIHVCWGPLEHGHALHSGMNARQICVPIQHKTKWMRSFFVYVRVRTYTRLTPRLYNPKGDASSRNHSRSKSILIPRIPLILVSIQLKKQTNPTNPTNLDSERETLT